MRFKKGGKMVNIGIRYVNIEKNTEGIVIGGDKGIRSRPSVGGMILECDPFIPLYEFPVLFAPASFFYSAAIHDFANTIRNFLYEYFKPKSFSVSSFTNLIAELDCALSKRLNSYYPNGIEKYEYIKFDFDFFLAGSDTKGEAFLYYIRIKNSVDIEDIKSVPGFGITLCGAAEGMVFLKEILQDREIISREEAIIIAVCILEILRRIIDYMANKYILLILENGKINRLHDDVVEKLRGFADYRWNALWTTLRNGLKYPLYFDFIKDKIGG